ncbi:cbb3-type cytochrome c oxidase N-terminal domain-containing protein [Agriterribacter sp.]|uniref:cbb3-type cytochrome c oxidase N-terminal domain-containing protein n=1 Tax=Agriterribacter sp. TaxID=2821509 RepID=UPI002CE78CDF|nr:cbb3-type cytochrome c oxidase N-terminal domain-containing protein [Agriterribacter sp.]HTN06672.1 cbb3-type cytochrome c oxidase N-terminal domain-containing protein [Agriterribacter sp.]
MLFKNNPHRLVRIFKPLSLLVLFTFTGSLAAVAAGPPLPSALNNTLALTLMTLMLILLVVIFMLGQLLTGIADIKLQKDKEDEKKNTTPAAVVTGVFLLLTGSAVAQNTTEAIQAAVANPKTFGGLSAFVFYTMITIIFVEMLVILVLLYNIRFLLKADKVKTTEAALVTSKSLGAWWSRVNKFKPVEQEADIALDHEYDGIRELDNRLPPWWLYGFYATIIFGVIYLWRYHVSYSAPLSREEFEISVKKADEEVKTYLAQKGESVDENSVTVSVDAADLAEGKKIYTAACVACHKNDGGGMVGPNLTDDYWLHGGDVKSVFKTIKYGINAMPQWQTSYSNKQIAQVSSYVMSLHGTNPAGAKAAEGRLFKAADATPAPVAGSAANNEVKTP